ncbi:Hypothetical protein SCF082_LOCUS15594 [Durusdinium trenchii]|uniref:Uncharacterized protein n=2 Tax=Durusdinium trenchii TaxID=1381693 RepID=A0ABP0K5Q4_9DINO
MSTKQPVSPSGEDILELLEATTAPEQRLSDHLHAPQLLRWSLCSGTWRAQLARSPAWRRLARWRFGEQLELTGPWPEAWGAQLREERDTLQRWEFGALNSEKVLAFSSFVRCWVTDAQLLVAGLFNGALQVVHWETGRKELLNGRHGDEVIAVALNDQHVLSGSGEPGYYARQAQDASVRLWRRDADGDAGPSVRPAGCFKGHADSVRAVALFHTEPLKDYGLSGSVDCHVILWRLSRGEAEATALLCGPCRCLRVLCEGTARARIFAGSGEGVAELALTRTSTGSSTATLTQLKFVSAYVEVSSLSYFPSPPLRQDMDQGHWPKSFLGANLKVAVGSVDGQFALLQAGSCRAVHELFKPSEGVSQEVISLVMISDNRILLVSRAGILTLLAWEGLLSSEAPCRAVWSKTGWRMYVSTIGLWGPGRLISDGFDNIIRTFTLERKTYFDEMQQLDEGTSSE